MPKVWYTNHFWIKMNKNFIVRNTHITQLPFNLIGCPIAGYSIDRGHHLKITIIELHLFRLVFLTVCLMTFLGIAPLSRVLSSLATTCHSSLASSSCCLRIISILNNQYNGWLRKRVWKHLTGKSMFTEKILTYSEFPLSNEIVPNSPSQTNFENKHKIGIFREFR